AAAGLAGFAAAGGGGLAAFGIGGGATGSGGGGGGGGGAATGGAGASASSTKKAASSPEEGSRAAGAALGSPGAPGVSYRKLEVARRAVTDHHALRVAGRSEPEDVAVMQGRLSLDAGVVHVESARAPRVVHLRPGQVEPDAGVDGADAGDVEAELRVGIGADE